MSGCGVLLAIIWHRSQYDNHRLLPSQICFEEVTLVKAEMGAVSLGPWQEEAGDRGAVPAAWNPYTDFSIGDGIKS
jgi:hypothetical protein